MSTPTSNPFSAGAGDDEAPGSPSEAEAVRLIVVGSALAEQVEQLLQGRSPRAEVVSVPSFLAAMGEIRRGPADAVVGSVQAMTGMVASTAEHLRKLLPEGRLLAVAGEADRPQAEVALGHGFDQVLTDAMDRHELLAALNGNAEPSLPAGGETNAESAETAAHDTHPADDDAELGDVDLVEAILQGRGQLGPLAVRLVSARSGIAGVRWANPGQAVPPDHVTASVHFRGRHFGHLHAPPPAHEDHLGQWAAWFSRWLALEEQVRQLENLSMKDELTGVWNRRYFNRFLAQILDRATRDRSQVTLLVFDIDDFKIYNDKYGHAAGDEILRETARLMESFVRDHDVVARIGGDEFAVIFWDAGQKRRPDSFHPESVREAAQRFQEAVYQHRFPKLAQEAPGTLTISGGLASFPWDGRTPADLLELADAMAMQSKRQGKNAITFGPGALRQYEES